MKRSLLATLGLMIGGCGSVPVAIDAPASTEALAPAEWQVAATSPTDETTTTEPAAPVDEAWWLGFEDRQLSRLVEVVLASNRDLRSAATRLDAALAQARIAGAALQPQASLGLNAGRARQNFIGLPIPGAEGGVLSNTSTNIGTSLNVSWEADLWGRLRAGRNAAELRAEAAAFDLADAGLSLTGQTAKAWFSFVEATSQVELAGEILENRTRVRERIERRYLSGLRTALELRLAIANQAGAAATLAGRERQLDLTRRQIEFLAGRDPEALDILDRAGAAPARLPRLPPAPEVDRPIDTLRRRPDLGASERRLAAAGLDVVAARKLLYPQLNLTGSTGRSSNRMEDLVDSDFSVWSLATGLLQPLFQGGRLRAGVDLARANHLDVLSRHESAVLRALTDVESQLAADGFLADQHRAVETAASASSAARRIAQDRYFAGLTDYIAVLAAEASATEASSQLLDIERRRLDQRVDLYLSLGGGLPQTQVARRPASDSTQNTAALAAIASESEELQ